MHRLVNATAAFGLALATALASPGSARAAQPLRLLLLGDSLTAGYGLPRQEAFPARLQAALQAKGLAVTVIDAGVSGDTTAGGVARLAWVLGSTPEQRPDAAVVELGANDALRGVAPKTAEANLGAILRKLDERGVPVLLAGMRAPPNLGADYVRNFDAIFPRLAQEYDVMLYPFFLEGVAADARLNQADGVHPNAAGVAVIVERITPQVAALLKLAAERNARQG